MQLKNIGVDEESKQILLNIKTELKSKGRNASYSEAIRELERRTKTSKKEN